MKTEILRILRYNEKYVSGQEICNTLGVSRTAVWKVINQLKEEGYEIEAVPNKGYYLVQSPDILTSEEIQSRLHTLNIAEKIYFYEEIDSTNTQAKRLADQVGAHGLLVVSEMQNTGKGRRGRSWISPKGSGIWMSLVLNPSISPVKASMLTLVAALAVAKVLREDLNMEAFIKWPNDIVVNGKKVCGILTEMSAEPDYINYVVIGIGINVYNESFSDELREIATSLCLEGEVTKTRSQLIALILKEFEQYYEVFLQEQNLSQFMKQYNERLINCNREVQITGANGELRGQAIGINQEGHLLVDTGQKVEEIFAGEVSVRGVYGYV